MSKSAQQKFNEFCNESSDTRNYVRAFVRASYDKHGSYGHAAGYLESLVGNLIMELPKSKRESARADLMKAALKVGI